MWNILSTSFLAEMLGVSSAAREIDRSAVTSVTKS
jgi:hypothetical protein